MTFFNFEIQNWNLYKNILCTILLILNNIVPLLICIAFFTVAERKILASLQRRFGPNRVGYWGLLQAFADGFKLINKEIILPTKSNVYLYFFAPMLALFLSFFSWGFIPLSSTSLFFNDEYNTLIILAISSLNVYTIIIAGWASNSKYSFLGGLRSSAQMISYEVSISICLVPVFLNSNSLNLSEIVNSQINGWFFWPLLPVAVIFFISIIAETNRAPFDLPEAEAELVAGFNLEYSSIVFAFFFLGEYGNILLMSTFFTILFLGGWWPLFDWLTLSPIFWISIKTLFCCFLFILIRGSLPRYRYDQLMYIGWKTFLPVSLSFLFFYVTIFFLFNALKTDFYNFEDFYNLCLNQNLINSQIDINLNELYSIKNIIKYFF